MRVSVVICSYNPRLDYLLRALDALRSQTLPMTEWELLLVDNHSTDPLEDRIDLRWHPNRRLVREESPGLARARVRGVEETRGEVIVFADDDNVLHPDYLEQCLAVAEAWPQLGVWGDRLRASSKSSRRFS